jgi:hypothetical protein
VSKIAHASLFFLSALSKVLFGPHRSKRGKSNPFDDDSQAELIRRYVAPWARAAAHGYPVPSTADLEAFWTEGEDARRPVTSLKSNTCQPDRSPLSGPCPPYLKIPSHDCCVGVDWPGFGHCHAADCPAMARRASLPEPLQSFVSEPPCKAAPGVMGVEVRKLIAELDCQLTAHHEGLLAQLPFASRDLAHWLLRVPAAGCPDCLMLPLHGEQQHTGICRVGRVVRIVEDLLRTAKPKAERPEEVRAGDGIAPRGLNERVCLKCGARDGLGWSVADVPVGTVDAELLGLNQLLSDGHSFGSIAIHTHDCGSHAAKGGAQ